MAARADINRGDWGPVLDLEFQCIHIILLKDGNILALSEDGNVPNHIRLWTPPAIDTDPADTGELTVINPPQDLGGLLIRLYCARHTQLADGRIVLIGGGGSPGSSHDHTVIFDPDSPVSDPWTLMVDMPVVQPPTGPPVDG